MRLYIPTGLSTYTSAEHGLTRNLDLKIIIFDIISSINDGFPMRLGVNYYINKT